MEGWFGAIIVSVRGDNLVTSRKLSGPGSFSRSALEVSRHMRRLIDDTHLCTNNSGLAFFTKLVWRTKWISRSSKPLTEIGVM